MSLVRSGTSQLRYGARIQRGGRRHRERLPTAAGREPDVPSNFIAPRGVAGNTPRRRFFVVFFGPPMF
jgi:hypothetical protein